MLNLILSSFRFQTQLPEACALLRSKVFPCSLFSDNTSNPSTSRNPSPEPESKSLKKTHSLSRAPSTSRFPSPALSTSSRTTSKVDTRALVRSRSRSLSISLAQEKERERAAASAAPSKKRVLNREISMSRAFKPKPKPKDDKTTTERGPKPAPVKPKVKDLGVTLVEETPVKPRLTSTKSLSFSQASLGIAPIKDLKGKPKNLEKDGTFLAGGGSNQQQLGILDEEEEEWMLTSSPDILLLNPKQSIGSSFDLDSDGEVEEAQATPSKPSRKRRKSK